MCPHRVRHRRRRGERQLLLAQPRARLRSRLRLHGWAEQKTCGIEHIVQLTNHAFITVANPKGNSKISLIFMHLPDGNLNGQGFKDSGYESVARLESGAIGTIGSVDTQSTYNLTQLSAALTSLMHTYQPTEIRTQANFISTKYPDHSDHMARRATGETGLRAVRNSAVRQPSHHSLTFYIGYPIHAFPRKTCLAKISPKSKPRSSPTPSSTAAVCNSLAKCQATPPTTPTSNASIRIPSDLKQSHVIQLATSGNLCYTTAMATQSISPRNYENTCPGYAPAWLVVPITF